MVPRLSVDAARRQEDRLEPVLEDAAAGLVDGRGDVVGWHHGGAVESRRIGLAVIVQPVVVGAGDGGREGRLETIGSDLLARVVAQRVEDVPARQVARIGAAANQYPLLITAERSYSHAERVTRKPPCRE